MQTVSRVEIIDNTPINGEAYAILHDGQRYAFAWGPQYPYADRVPASDVLDGASGLSWHDTEDAARAAMNRAVEAWSDIRGN